jgi:serine protease
MPDPDLYLRDFVGDTGATPSTGSVSSSPDIILLNAQVPTSTTPQMKYGQGSPDQDNDMLSDDVRTGQDNFLYLRVRNGGAMNAATDALVTVAWAPPASLIHPSMWQVIGSATIPSVPIGNVLTVSDAITWPAATLPPPGHYCFVGLVDAEADSATLPMSDFPMFDDYVAFIRNVNNFTWRNFNVIAPPSPGSGPRALPFQSPGARDKDRLMELEVVSRLPEQARVLLEAPLELLQNLPPGEVEVDKQQGIGRIAIGAHPQRLEAVFPAEAQFDLQFLVEAFAPIQVRQSDLFARQLFEGQEVGRVTWRIAADRHRDQSLAQ